MSEWQPSDSAPKDGQWIVVRYVNDSSPPKLIRWLEYEDYPGEAGWRSGEGFYRGELNNYQVWLDIPKLPVEDDK